MSDIFLKRKLGDTIDVRSENLNIMRFAAVLMIIVSNAFLVCTGSEFGQITIREIAVSFFFFCGGYLAAISVERRVTAKRFFGVRVKRLIPSAFFVTVATMILCSFFSTWKPVGYVVSMDTWKYLLNSVFIPVREMPGVFSTHPTPIVNNAYTPMMVGMICYVLCFIAYKLGFFEKKRFLISAPLVLIASVVFVKIIATSPSHVTMLRWVVLFYMGIGYWVYREHILLDVKYFAIAVLLFAILFVVGLDSVAMCIVFPYVVMYICFGMKQCSPKLGKLGDYSYGIYLWGFVVQQMVFQFYLASGMSPLVNAVIAIPISIVAGMLTYEIVENNAKGIPLWLKNFKCPDVVYIALLVMYSMRHVTWGLDLADTGYSYSNFQYMSFEHMDSMWVFSTYLANVVGNILSKLPFANTLIGMNFYTTLLVAGLAAIGYFFCTRTLKMSRWVVFAGELLALALCWCPSAVLYNYVTYILVVLCVVFLYKGLTTDKSWWLFAAGVCLGANILTRFSNLPQAALILAVWAYGFIESRERKEKGALKETVNRTLWCLGGWLAGFGGFLLYIHIRYGINEYIEGIIRLFAMTEVAEGYTPTGMLTIVFEQFTEVFPWLKELGVYMIKGTLVWIPIVLINKFVGFAKERKYVQNILNAIGIASSIYLGKIVVERLYYSGFCDMNYYYYKSIIGPAILFMMLTVVIMIIKLVDKRVDKNEKLAAIMIVLLLAINSIGSSNGLFSSFNNLCLAAPFTLWNIYLYVRKVKEMKVANMTFSAWPVKTVLIAFLYVLFWQSGLFGQYFFFTESTGATDVVATVENNEVLEGIKMHPHKAEWLTSISKYVNENELEGREVILYGNVPALSFYLQMPPAFNSWPDLGSYNIKQMTIDMEELQTQIDEAEVIPPLIIADAIVSQYTDDQKWNLILDFMEDNNYECTFYNGKLLMYEPMLSE